MHPGIHLVHKPVGATSFSLVRACMEAIAARGLTRQLPVCHGGALDPFAEGLMLLLVGPATRLVELVHAAPKCYRATVVWGVETDNGDPHGRVVSRGAASGLTEAALEAALARFLGWREQVPPHTSNKRVDGERAYVKAHRGERFVLAPSRVMLCEARWLAHRLPRESELELVCGGGFYVRALARDLGRVLGCGAHLGSLRRTAVGPWKDPAERVWIHGRGILPWLPSRELEPDEALHIEQGRPVACGRVAPPEWPLPQGMAAPEMVRAIYRDALVALLAVREDRLAPQVKLVGGI